MLLDKKIPVKYIISKIKVEIIYILLIALAVNYITRVYINLIPAIPFVIPTFLGTAMSVILSFKLGQSYDRWWEARKIWGGIVNDSRNLILQLQAFVADGNQHELEKIALRHIAWCYGLGRSLRGLDVTAAFDGYLEKEEQVLLQKQSNKPLGILQLNTKALRDLREKKQLEEYSYVQLTQTIAALTNYMGMAERIKSTVFPVTYRLFLHMIIYVFIVTLSISLRDLENYIEIPLLLVIAAFFFLIERTATHLQDPFSNKPTDTAMTAIATNIEINIKQLLGMNDVPRPCAADGFYLN
jgi:putative membrane protein